jgi:hypothetical protein
MSASCSAIAAFLTSSCEGMMLVSCENMLFHFSMVLLNASAHFFGFVSFMLNQPFEGCLFVYCLPWSMFQVMGKWSVVNESL